ncbi:hypothetical protein [Burkholderia pseudomallei]|uniref:hypothetical protein n=1 Tax=Burkholderia pseudomallei TaxID=28450 RepID=UPI00405910A2
MNGDAMSGMCEAQTICFELMKGVPAAVVTIAVAIGTGAIAWRQYHVAKAKLNLDLFEKRYELFTLMWGYLSEMTRGPTQRRAQLRVDFTNSIPKLEFLCGASMTAYARFIIQQAGEFESIEFRTKENGRVVPPEDVNRRHELMKWFWEESSEGLRRRFGEFLDFEKWR